MFFRQIATVSVLFLSTLASPVPEPAPLDPGLQRVVSEKNGMGGAGNSSTPTRLETNGALRLSSPQKGITFLAAVSLPAIAAGAASLL
ncbi:hypothetical protein D9757_000454 [Collybiopsis confluens]|uniref:Uncharacterized protein n=1 Tax=Collybiopsis confluens TaxID=2823264 RepID=A0A8H5I1R8_9AGAR|nr:hypothetical protein D9757_006500 [Collybiopsis confluens]KAF5393448.1 hypothetical protein D9757_000454 [Collybiopsis confluens]